MADVFQALEPGFDIQVQQGSYPEPSFTVFDRAGNIIDLTGFTLKFAAKRVDFRSNGMGKITRQETVLIDVDVTIDDAQNGNVSFVLGDMANQVAAAYPASLRLWSSGSSSRLPTDAYAGTVTVVQAVVREEAV